MISAISFNNRAIGQKISKNSFNQRFGFGSSEFQTKNLEQFLKSKTYDHTCIDEGKILCAREWLMSDNDMIFLAKNKVTVIDFDFDKISGTKKFAKRLGLNYLGLDDIANNPKDIKDCYNGIVKQINKSTDPVLLYSFKTQDLQFYLSALYLIKEKGLSISDAAELIENKLVIQPRFDLAGMLKAMLKEVEK